MKNLWSWLIEWKHRGRNASGVEKHYPKSFKDMKKRLPIFVKTNEILLNFIFKLGKVYYFNTFFSSFFSFFDVWYFARRFFVLFVIFVLFFWKDVKCLRCLWCSTFNFLYIRIEVYISNKSSDSFVDIWGIQY